MIGRHRRARRWADERNLVLALFLAEPDWPHYGLELWQRTKIRSGRLYRLLDELLEANIVVAGWDIDPRDSPGPMNRRYYRLNRPANHGATP